MMRKAIATVALSGTLPEKLEAIARAGFTAVEIFADDLQTFPGSVRDIHRLTQALELEVVLLQPLRDFVGAPPERRAEVNENAQRMLEQMNQLGCGLLLACSGTDAATSPEPQAQIEDLGCLANLAQQHDCAVAFEALAWGTYVNRLSQAWDRVRAVNHPHLGIMLDSFHVLAQGEGAQEIMAIPADKLYFLQMADAAARPYPAMPVDQWSRHHRCFPGRGTLAVTAFAAAAQQAGYQGVWSLEIFNDRYRQTAPAAVAAEGFASLQWLERNLPL
ncbi:sugar phosphate isomerase/epimerase [Candidatus Sodalis sp. SoCistrobi]|uniref:sugar phosphate isomerase/epimerase family protein n=1 Tax=Candidatus Sodalis sp. SoCistrobi TaxID=1922216 RepID=UPI000939AEB6|nr:sugar phosphate isomerase/epimerase family protein [Candidatus Sodalis sp. SoCistrobi]